VADQAAGHADQTDDVPVAPPRRGRIGRAAAALDARIRAMDRADWALVAIVVAGLVLRVAYVLVNQDVRVTGDGDTYVGSARLLADGHGFLSAPIFGVTQGGGRVPAAEHPPAWIIVLSSVALLGATKMLSFQLLAALVGTTTVGVVGLTGRRIAGVRCGLIAAFVAAFYPNLWMYERVMQCETLGLLLTALCVFVAYGFRARPRLRGVVLLGLLVGLLAMTRPEAVLMLPLLLVPLVLFDRTLPWATRGRWLAAGTAMVLLPIVPWAAYNTARFHQPVGLTTNLGGTLASSNCEAVYEGPQIGLWNYQCLADATAQATRATNGGGPAALDVEMRHIAFDYMGDHAGRLPLVMLAREGRAWGVFDPFGQLAADSIGGPSHDVAHLGLQAYWPLGVAALAGVVVLRRRRVALSPLLAMVATVVISVAFTIGQTRYRALAEVSVVLLAAVAVDALLRWQPRDGHHGAASAGVDTA
jgi:hypothetical protein